MLVKIQQLKVIALLLVMNQGLLDSSRSNTTGVGYQSLANVTSGTSNTAVGANAGDVIADGLNNVIIGKGSDPSASNATNQTVIGYAVTSCR